MSHLWIGTAIFMAIASLWLFLQTTLSTEPDEYNEPMLFISKPRWEVYTANGEPSQTLHADQLEKWSKNEPAYLQRPLLEFQDRQQRDWRVSAQQGWVEAQHRVIQLRGQVVVERDAPGGQIMNASMETLEINHTSGLLSSDTAVEITLGSWHFNANGLRANMNEPRVTLLNDVRGIHE